MLTYVEVSKQIVEFILGADIVIMLQHIYGQTLAETTGADEKEEPVGLFD